MSSYLPYYFFVLGAIFGSFANVLILRVPQEKSIMTNSSCPSCKNRIPWFCNIPIFSWIFLLGKCVKCKARISIQYLIVELLMGFLFYVAFNQFGFSWYLLEILIFIVAAVSAAFIDLKHYILPDVFTLGGLAIALIGAAINPERSFWDALMGFLLGGGFLYLTAYLHYLIRKIEGMGGGDIKLMAWIGALMGWQSVFFVLIISSIMGAIVGIGSTVFFKRSLKEPLPFGPFIVFAAFIFIFVDTHTMVQFLLSYLGLIPTGV